jgi:hypothetical protein
MASMKFGASAIARRPASLSKASRMLSALSKTNSTIPSIPSSTVGYPARVALAVTWFCA